jgi:starch phosphorylase
VEAELLYDLLEREVVPLFFERDRTSGLPRGWIKRMKMAISNLVPAFNTARMVKEYTGRFYVPANALATRLSGDLSAAERLAAWKERVRAAWPKVVIHALVPRSPDEVKVGEPVVVEAKVSLGELSPEDVAVELYYGPTHGGHELRHGAIVRMSVATRTEGGEYTFVGEIPTSESGAHAFTARVMPYNPAMSHPYETSLVRWG